jgi:hypothetical protein
VASPKALFFHGKLFVVGDVQITLRSNVGLSTTHAAFDCNELEKVVEGKITAEQWERAVLRWRKAQRRFAMAVSAYGLVSRWEMVWLAICWIGVLVGQRIGLL